MLAGAAAPAVAMLALFLYYEHLELVHDLAAGRSPTRADWPDEELAEFMAGFGATVAAWLIAQLGPLL